MNQINNLISKSIAESLADIISIDVDEIKKYISTCPYRYKKYSIPKRNGQGVRVIAQPTKELKFLQRLVCEKYLSKIPVHEACKAYKKYTNIKDNAFIHVKNSYLLKMDFKDFFPSITPILLLTHLEKYLEWKISPEDKQTISRIFFYLDKQNKCLRLSIGAPTSPFISNSIMYDFDCAINLWCTDANVAYSRYADDISFSTKTKGVLYQIPQLVRSTLVRCNLSSISINEQKTRFCSRKGNMQVTGLVLSSEGKISLGRDKKRYIKSLVHRFKNSTIEKDELNYLVGYLAFCKPIEPTFLTSLREKYGNSIIDKLQNSNGL